jgi:hypothetical protein
MLARFSRYMQPAVDVAHLKDLIAKMTFSASQDPDVTRILPSGCFSITSVVLSDVASFSRTFSNTL